MGYSCRRDDAIHNQLHRDVAHSELWLQVRLVSSLPWLPVGSTAVHVQWTPASAGLLALVSEMQPSGAAGVFARTCVLEMLALTDAAAYDVVNPDGSHARSPSLPGSDAAPRVQLSAAAVKRYEAACPFVSKLPALPDLHSAIAEGAAAATAAHMLCEHSTHHSALREWRPRAAVTGDETCHQPFICRQRRHPPPAAPCAVCRMCAACSVAPLPMHCWQVRAPCIGANSVCVQVCTWGTAPHLRCSWGVRLWMWSSC